MIYTAVEFKITDQEIKETGRTELYTADDRTEAIQAVLYTKKLKDARAYIGPAGCVYASGFGYAVHRGYPSL